MGAKLEFTTLKGQEKTVKINLISVIIPCFNENETIEEFLRRLHFVASSMEDYKFEFIFINDGSTDNTGKILNDFAEQDHRIKVLHLARNRGHQIALTAGMDHATGDMIVTIDADLQDPPELIGEMLEKIEKGFDIVHAQRKTRLGESWFKMITSRLFYRLMVWCSITPIIPDCGDFRAFTRAVLETITAFRMPHRFLRGTFASLGFNQIIIQYDRSPRYSGYTKYSFFKMLNLSVDAVLGFSTAPIRFISWISIVLWAVSLIYLIYALIGHFIYKLTVPGWTSIIVLLFLFTGLILFSIAIIGSYVGRIFSQGQNVPLYWLSDARNMDFDKIVKNSDTVREVSLSKNILDRQKKN